MADYTSYTGTTQYRGYQLRLDIVEGAYNAETNETLTSWFLYIVNGNSRFAAAPFSYKVTIDGSVRVNYSGSEVDTTDVAAHQPHFLASGYYTKKHNADGSASMTVSATCSGGGSYGPGNGSCGGTYKLKTQPRAATINSFSGNDIDTDFTIGFTKYVNDWTYYLRISMADDTQVDRAVYNTSGEVYRLSESGKDIIYNAVGNDDTVNLKAVIETWNGDTKIGESTALTNTCDINRNVWININGTWKRGIPHVNVNGEWKKGIPYININGVWKKAI